MTRAKPTKKTPSRRPRRTSTIGSDGAEERAVDHGFEDLVDLIEATRSPGAGKGRASTPRVPSQRSATSEPLPELAAVISGPTDDDAQLRALAAAVARAVALPADAFVIGEPVEIVAIDYGGHPRAGLTASCHRDGTVHRVGLADVTFLPGSAGAGFVSMYRAWLGLGEPAAAATTAARSGKRHKATADDLDLSQPLDLIVLACEAKTLRCRIPGTARELTLRTAVRNEVPGEIITVRPSKQWNHAGHPYLSGNVLASRPDVLALGVTPLGLHEQGEWDPDLAYWGEDDEPIEDWAQPIIARGKRPSFEAAARTPAPKPGAKRKPATSAIDRDKLRAALRRLSAEAVFDLLDAAIAVLPPVALTKLVGHYVDVKHCSWLHAPGYSQDCSREIQNDFRAGARVRSADLRFTKPLLYH